MAKISKSRRHTAFYNVDRTWLLFAAVAGLYLFALWIPLVGPDEPRYAQVAREMYERGDWVSTTLGGFNWFEKPALLYWLQIAAYSIFGVSEFSARLGPALFGLGTAGSLYLLGRGYCSSTTDSGENRLPFWIFAVGATSLGLIVFSRGASFDITVTFPLTASLTSFFLWFLAADRNESRTKRTALLMLFYFFAGLAVLAKGLIGILFPAATIAFFYILTRSLPKKELLISLIWGPAVTAVTAGTWYLPMYLRHGWEFIDEFFIQHHFQRFTSNKYKHPQPFWFFFAIFPLMTIPWVPFFFAAVWKYGRSLVSDWTGVFRKDDAAASERPDALAVFAIAWMLVPLVFFSYSGSKLPGYVLPSLPAAAVLTALFVGGFAARSRKVDLFCKWLAGAMIAVIFLLLTFIVPAYADADSVKGLIVSADDAGYSRERVVNYLNVSHSAEFYAAGRLVRNSDGTQRIFSTAGELEQFALKEPTGRLLVLVPNWLVSGLMEIESIHTDTIATRGELTILAAESSSRSGAGSAAGNP